MIEMKEIKKRKQPFKRKKKVQNKERLIKVKRKEIHGKKRGEMKEEQRKNKKDSK